MDFQPDEPISSARLINSLRELALREEQNTEPREQFDKIESELT
ncbi:MAG: hypothetical protein OER97_06790 [Gammaproteobacteria bacterium]|nr:hypothetical protein [Gammaproteobacteria bacterium]